VLDSARRLAPGAWPIAEGVVVKTRPVPALKRCRGWRRRHAIGRGELAAALDVVDPGRVRDAAVLMFDDVMTTGATCCAVAGALRAAGAARVGAIVLARRSLGAAPSARQERQSRARTS
jgi:orotate phosphoribosyltransferase